MSIIKFFLIAIFEYHCYDYFMIIYSSFFIKILMKFLTQFSYFSAFVIHLNGIWIPLLTIRRPLSCYYLEDQGMSIQLESWMITASSMRMEKAFWVSCISVFVDLIARSNHMDFNIFLFFILGFKAMYLKSLFCLSFVCKAL